MSECVLFTSQEELRKFIKFACNQERIPFGNPCRDGGKDSAMNIPPYPMKIAPPDGSGELYIESQLTYSTIYLDCVIIISYLQGLLL